MVIVFDIDRWQLAKIQKNPWLNVVETWNCKKSYGESLDAMVNDIKNDLPNYLAGHF